MQDALLVHLLWAEECQLGFQGLLYFFDPSQVYVTQAGT